MSDNNNKEPTSRVKPTTGKHEKKKPASASSWLIACLFLLLIAGCAAGYFFWLKTREEISLLHSYIIQIEQKLVSKSESVSEFQRKLTQAAAETKSQDSMLKHHLQELENNLSQLDTKFNKISDATVSNQVWLLSEVEYLLKAADHRILMKEDVKGAINILKSADALIKKMPVEDKGLLTVRVAIAKDIASLQGTSDIDVPGTYAQLTALGDQIERLPLIRTNFEKQPAPHDSDSNKKPDILAKINKTMHGYLSIQRHDVASLKALLSQEDRASLRDGLRLAIEQSQTALLLGNQRIYDQSLAKIRSRVHQYFVADSIKVQQVIKKIDALLKVQVRNDLPDISGSQQALKRYLNERARNNNS